MTMRIRVNLMQKHTLDLSLVTRCKESVSESITEGPELITKQFISFKPVLQKPYILPNRDDWDRLFQLMFDEYYNPPTIVVSPIQEVAASRVEVLADSPVSTSIDHGCFHKQVKTDESRVRVLKELRGLLTSFRLLASSRRGIVLARNGYVDSRQPIAMCKSYNGSSFGLFLALSAWFVLLSCFLICYKISLNGAVDPTLFTRHAGNDILLDTDMSLTTYVDADHVRCQDTRRSTSGSAQFLGGKLVSWSSKKQKSTAIPNNKSAIALCCNNVQHSRARHIDIRYHFIKEQVENGIVELYSVRTEYQLDDIFTKPLPRERFNFLIDKLGMRSMSLETLKRLAEETDE
ncbi:hypothetical protein Tco_0706942 [Tanacetum coccineum]|uniref:Retrovirus-related Pol polyprotein from transposon TNT 1-94 n=1 Tax=Tanacetum coccineum TaxID=301880 RepID=A0ABQ4YAE8_9ASTR